MRIEILGLEELVEHIWGNFALVVFKVILEPFGQLSQISRMHNLCNAFTCHTQQRTYQCCCQAERQGPWTSCFYTDASITSQSWLYYQSGIHCPEILPTSLRFQSSLNIPDNIFCQFKPTIMELCRVIVIQHILLYLKMGNGFNLFHRDSQLNIRQQDIQLL